MFMVGYFCLCDCLIQLQLLHGGFVDDCSTICLQAWALVGRTEEIVGRFSELVLNTAVGCPFELDKFQFGGMGNPIAFQWQGAVILNNSLFKSSLDWLVD